MEGIKTVNDLREILSDEIIKLRTGKSTAANLNALVNATGKILSSYKIEIEYNKLQNKVPNIPFMSKEVKELPPSPSDNGVDVLNLTP